MFKYSWITGYLFVNFTHQQTYRCTECLMIIGCIWFYFQRHKLKKDAKFVSSSLQKIEYNGIYGKKVKLCFLYPCCSNIIFLKAGWANSLAGCPLDLKNPDYSKPYAAPIFWEVAQIVLDERLNWGSDWIAAVMLAHA